MSWLPTWLQPTPAPQDGSHGGIRSAPTDPQSSRPLSPFPAKAENASRALDARLEDEVAAVETGPIKAIPLTGFTLGFGAGLYQSAKRASLVFMAENAHRRPDTVQGWYFYNKTKNYRVLLAGFTGGFKTGTRVGMWTLAYVGIEYGVSKLQQEYSRRKGLEREEQSAQWVAGGVAGAGIASAASLLYRLPGPVARRALVLGLIAGGSVGALRDVQHHLTRSKAAV